MQIQPYVGFVGPSYTTQSKIAADDRTVNWIPSKIESGTGPAAYVFDPAPGFQSYCTLGDTPVRGFFSLNGGDFAVGGENLYELPSSSGGSPILRAEGIVNLDNTPVSIAGNGDGGHQLMLASCSKLYCFELLTNTLTLIPDITATFVVFQDGYFIALNPNTSTIYLSALENGLSWDLLDAAQRNDSPDKWLSMIVRPKEVWLFGSESTSVYYDDGNADFPFVPNPSVAIPYGCPAPYSVGLVYGSPIWLANDLTVRYAAGNGYTGQRVSTHAVEFAIAGYAQDSIISDADCFTYEENGHAFYVLNFPTAGATWVFDLRRVRRAPHLVEGLKRIRYGLFRLHMEVGLGLASGQGSNPLAMLRYSNDGGQTWSEPTTASAGRVGNSGALVDWFQLGQARDRVFELSVSDPIPWRLVQAFLRMSVGAS